MENRYICAMGPLHDSIAVVDSVERVVHRSSFPLIIHDFKETTKYSLPFTAPESGEEEKFLVSCTSRSFTVSQIVQKEEKDDEDVVCSKGYMRIAHMKDHSSWEVLKPRNWVVEPQKIFWSPFIPSDVKGMAEWGYVSHSFQGGIDIGKVTIRGETGIKLLRFGPYFKTAPKIYLASPEGENFLLEGSGSNKARVIFCFKNQEVHYLQAGPFIMENTSPKSRAMIWQAKSPWPMKKGTELDLKHVVTLEDPEEVPWELVSLESGKAHPYVHLISYHHGQKSFFIYCDPELTSVRPVRKFLGSAYYGPLRLSTHIAFGSPEKNEFCLGLKKFLSEGVQVLFAQETWSGTPFVVLAETKGISIKNPLDHPREFFNSSEG